MKAIDKLIRRAWDWWDVAAYPFMRWACVHLDCHSSWCRGRTYCRVGWGATRKVRP